MLFDKIIRKTAENSVKWEEWSDSGDDRDVMSAACGGHRAPTAAAPSGSGNVPCDSRAPENAGTQQKLQISAFLACVAR